MIYKLFLKLDSKYNSLVTNEYDDAFKLSCITSGLVIVFICLGLAWILRSLGLTDWFLEYEWVRNITFIVVGFFTVFLGAIKKGKDLSIEYHLFALKGIYISLIVLFTLINQNAWVIFIFLCSFGSLPLLFYDEMSEDVYMKVTLIFPYVSMILYLFWGYRANGFSPESGFDILYGAFLTLNIPLGFRKDVLVGLSFIETIKHDKRYSIKKLKANPLTIGYYVGGSVFLCELMYLGELMMDDEMGLEIKK